MSRALNNTAAPLSRLEIHLDKIAHNYVLLQSRLARGVECAAVVKADAYGLGAARVAPALHAAGCRHFYVAHAQEGLALRDALGDADAVITALHGAAGVEVDALLHARIVPVLNTPGDIQQWSAVAAQRGARLPAVLHIDTGMNRLGLSAAEAAALTAGDLKALDVRMVMSHLACADAPAHTKNAAQLALFKKLTEQLNLPCPRSLANSSGIFLGPNYHFDQVRPGCSLYGIKPQEGIKNPMQGVVTLNACILQIHDIAAGETVGYGAAFTAPSAMKLATISAGYADGIFRSAAPRAHVHINGQACPFVGRVSMDLVVVDITQVPAARPGDWAEVLGAHNTVDDAAAAAGTIGYEILTNLGSRAARVYTG